MAAQKDFNIPSLRGGINEFDAPNVVPDDQVLAATNVEFNVSQLGERRLGSLAIASPSAITTLAMVTFLGCYLPTSDVTASELMAFAVTVASSYSLQRRSTTWNTITMSDAPTITGAYPFGLSGQTLHQKYFLGYKSSVDRLHLWDGTSFRRAGVATPAAPTGANTAAGGTFSGTRYYRVRFTVKSGSTTLRRSEPSAVLTFTPSGVKTGITVTKPATVSEGETHWELEASLDNVNFYVLATTVVGTTTFDDTTSAIIGYSAYTLSEDVGDYTVFGSGKFISVDNDRLLVGGSWDVESLASRVAWSPVFADPGVGNDERVPIATDNFLDLDAGVGGGLTGMSNTVDGAIYVTKWSQIWKLTRTGQREKAYDAHAITKVRGAIEGSLVEAFDEAGRACLFFLDPVVGPMRVGASGLFWAGKDITATWARVNVEATQVVARGVFYPAANQVRWDVAVDGSNTPNLGLVLQLDTQVMQEEGLRKGWTTFTGPSTNALAMLMYASNVDTANARKKALVPLIGVASITGNHIQILDSGATDGGTTSTNGTAYAASLTTKPYQLTGLLNQFELQSAALFAVANAAAQIRITLTRDMGLETASMDAPLTPVGDEDYVVKQLDSLHLAEAYMIQVTIADVDIPAGQWVLHALSFKPSAGQTG